MVKKYKPYGEVEKDFGRRYREELINSYDYQNEESGWSIFVKLISLTLLVLILYWILRWL